MPTATSTSAPGGSTSEQPVVLSTISQQVNVHPLVLLSVTDHASRAATGGRKRVVGVLLGQDDGKVVNVANSFAVPFEEDEGAGSEGKSTWFLDHDYITSMMEMCKKVNAREKIIGWYHTGPRLRASDLDINDLMKRFMPKPVMVIVDPRSRDTGIPTDAYIAIEEIKEDGTAAQKTFVHVPSSIVAEESEEIGVEHLLRDIRDTTTVGTLSTRVGAQLSSLRGLLARLLEIQNYLELVSLGKMPVNHEILFNVQDIFNLLDRTTEAQHFSTATNDQMLVIYLSSLIRAVIALHALVENRAQNAKGEEEDGTTTGEANGTLGGKKEIGDGKTSQKEGEKKK
ncbi:Mov34-domain-containing protein [Ceraceosorus guamensis]|uniref:Mov34-domain-containing protein n=1 Tax=Ceraceosorus guamensis TaxID=1522189 RepID=A0A316W585_9BASI|nr:Mov34-domain-containing protein [Ceraceosorus guamensis]PWN44774.1 Mov34-domain-containing protein [Ceraceosorus guamensis]